MTDDDETPPPTPLEKARALFAKQHGVASTAQVRKLGLSWESERTLVRNGDWVRTRPGVLAAAETTTTWKQRAMAATLMGGKSSMLGGPAAARLQGLDGFGKFDDAVIALPTGARPRRLENCSVLWTSGLCKKDRHTIDGVPVTTLPLTLVHLAAKDFDPEKALDSALRKRNRPDWLQAGFERYRDRRLRGATHMLSLLSERIGQRLPRSWFQRLAKRLLAENQITMVDEWPVLDDKGKLLAELDLAHVPLKVGVECQSVEFHDSPTDRHRDLVRKRRLRELGWEIVEVWWRDLDDMDSVMADLDVVMKKAARLADQSFVARLATND